MQPTELEDFRNKNVKMVQCGKYHTLFLIDGLVWATGNNKEGQIGNGTTQT
jgi:alpha-tubulin suppressor-like RCC1 family protein